MGEIFGDKMNLKDGGFLVSMIRPQPCSYNNSIIITSEGCFGPGGELLPFDQFAGLILGEAVVFLHFLLE